MLQSLTLIVRLNTSALTLEASRASRRRAWENLQEIRWIVKDTGGNRDVATGQKTIDLESRTVKDGVRKALNIRGKIKAVWDGSRRERAVAIQPA
jgi:hypothetical protein